jgi:transcriptional regulator with GAF, ATPase, and Fis domain
MALEDKHESAARNPADWDKLRRELVTRIESLEQEYQSVRERLVQVEEENQQFADRYLEVEEENNNLANLYVASYQLHSTMDLKEVLRIVSEIILNLIGSDHFAILVRDDEQPALRVVAAESVDPSVQKIKLGEGVIGRVGQSGEMYVQDDLEHAVMGSPNHPIVCIPLKIHEDVIGVIAIFDLFEQKKKRLTRVDHELFSMMAGHAATAIFSATLYARSQRTLSTIKGFIGLMSANAE